MGSVEETSESKTFLGDRLRGRVNRRSYFAYLPGGLRQNAGPWRLGILFHGRKEHRGGPRPGSGLHRLLLWRPAASSSLRRRLLEPDGIVPDRNAHAAFREEHFGRIDRPHPGWHRPGGGGIPGGAHLLRLVRGCRADRDFSLSSRPSWSGSRLRPKPLFSRALLDPWRSTS